MKLVVGLGNPGAKYAGTRHNIGFLVLGELAQRWQAARPRSAFSGQAAEATLAGQRVLLLRPQTFMNRSGASALAAKDFYKLDLAEVLVVCDDFHLPLEKLRFRAKGSAGGQKGLSDVMRCLGSEEVPRLRIGIGPPSPNWDPADFVLAKFTRGEQALVAEIVVRAAEAVEDWVGQGMDYCMNKYN
jgi:peptidyl-tRNA hydrolase, PTH1 family